MAPMPVEAPVMRTEERVLMCLLSWLRKGAQYLRVTSRSRRPHRCAASLALRGVGFSGDCGPPLSHLHDDLALGAPLGQVCQRILCLLERKHLVDHGPDALRLEELADFGELVAIGTHEEKR